MSIVANNRLQLCAVCSLIGALVFWYSPLSPVAIQLADAQIETSEYSASFANYEKIATIHWSARIRSMAIQRARLLCEIEGTNEAELLRLYELAELDEQRAEIEATIGSYYIRQQDFSVGASWLERAQQTAPNASSAGANLLAAARAREKAKQLSKAERLYTRLGKKYQDYAAQADIGLAELLLSDGKARSARRFFERAVRRASTADLSALAQFGVATCLERMGELDEALSEMDSVDLPMAILDERRDGIRAHQISEIGGM